MEQIINFLEQYWGMTIVGSVTLGTLITFIITQIKIILKDKVQTATVGTTVSKVDSLCEELNRREELHRSERLQLEQRLEAQHNELVEKEKYFENVQAATFQAISYLVIASKLPTEDKIALQEKFTSILTTKTTEYKEVIKDEVEAIRTEVSNKIVPDVIDTVVQTVDETKSLLDKYMTEV